MIRRAAAEAVGTAFLLAAVVGSGIMGERLSGGNVAIALSGELCRHGRRARRPDPDPRGAHMNPLVTALGSVGDAICPGPTCPPSSARSSSAPSLGVVAANADVRAARVFLSHHARHGGAQLLSESIATFGLILVVLRVASDRAALAVGGYIAAAYWFTASTSFANPAVTVARSLTDTFAGIEPRDIAGFVAAQAVGAAAATWFCSWLGEK